VDDDDADDEHWDETEPPDRAALSTRSETQDEFRLDEREEDAAEDPAAGDEDSLD
jgi:hypothetical protein